VSTAPADRTSQSGKKARVTTSANFVTAAAPLPVGPTAAFNPLSILFVVFMIG
jgi:hypothetical protein